MEGADLDPVAETPDGSEGGGAPATAVPHDSGEEVIAALLEDPHSFGFFQAVRLLERYLSDREPVGRFADPTREVARFSVNPVISFPASEIQDLALEENGPARMVVNFLGLIGPLGVLPYYYTLLVADRIRERDTALRDFLDLFQHRILSLFYRAWKKHRFEVAFESGDQDHVTQHLFDFLGLGGKATRNRLEIPDRALAFYTGLFGPQQRSAVALESLIADYFDVPVSVEQFVGGWYPLPAPVQCRLDREADPSTELGRGAVVGDEVWDPHARVRVRLGPLPRDRYEDFLPGSDGYSALRSLLRFYANDSFDFEVQLVLRREGVPGIVLGTEEGETLPLSWLTWIRTQPIERDPDDTILTL